MHRHLHISSLLKWEFCQLWLSISSSDRSCCSRFLTVSHNKVHSRDVIESLQGLTAWLSLLLATCHHPWTWFDVILSVSSPLLQYQYSMTLPRSWHCYRRRFSVVKLQKLSINIFYLQRFRELAYSIACSIFEFDLYCFFRVCYPPAWSVCIVHGSWGKSVTLKPPSNYGLVSSIFEREWTASLGAESCIAHVAKRFSVVDLLFCASHSLSNSPTTITWR